MCFFAWPFLVTTGFWTTYLGWHAWNQAAEFQVHVRSTDTSNPQQKCTERQAADRWRQGKVQPFATKILEWSSMLKLTNWLVVFFCDIIILGLKPPTSKFISSRNCPYQVTSLFSSPWQKVRAVVLHSVATHNTTDRQEFVPNSLTCSSRKPDFGAPRNSSTLDLRENVSKKCLVFRDIDGVWDRLLWDIFSSDDEVGHRKVETHGRSKIERCCTSTSTWMTWRNDVLKGEVQRPHSALGRCLRSLLRS